MSKEDVDWKSLFRSKVTSGITEDSVLYEIKTFTRNGVDLIIPGRQGFYFLISKVVYLLDIRGDLTEVFDGFSLGLKKDIRGDVIAELPDGYYNLDKSCVAEFQPVEMSSSYSVKIHPMNPTYFREKISFLGPVPYYQSKTDPTYLITKTSGREISYEFYSEDWKLVRNLKHSHPGIFYFFSETVCIVLKMS